MLLEYMNYFKTMLIKAQDPYNINSLFLTDMNISPPYHNIVIFVMDMVPYEMRRLYTAYV